MNMELIQTVVASSATKRHAVRPHGNCSGTRGKGQGNSQGKDLQGPVVDSPLYALCYRTSMSQIRSGRGITPLLGIGNNLDQPSPRLG